ncbi:MAG: hypothetical protein ABJ360_28420 [Roseobacter sp.]
MKRHGLIGIIRCNHGLMTATKLIPDRLTKAPIDGVSTIIVQEVAHQSGAMICVSGQIQPLSSLLFLSESKNIVLSALDAGLTAI